MLEADMGSVPVHKCRLCFCRPHVPALKHAVICARIDHIVLQLPHSTASGSHCSILPLQRCFGCGDLLFLYKLHGLAVLIPF